jgi:acyl dehydratase
VVPELAFEDFEPGEVTTFGAYRVEREEMVGFARQFDPQPFHLDEEAARTTGTGRLIASGWYNCAVQMRMICEGWLGRTFCLGSPGVEEVRWLRPVLAGDVLQCRQTILDKRLSSSRPGMGIMRFQIELENERGEPLMRTRHLVMVGRRGALLVRASGAPSPGGGDPPARHAPEDPARAPRSFEEIEIGRGVDLGTYEFTADRIVAFARSYDPQSFHLSEAGGAAGPFGALAASGWHTAAAWMRGYAARLARMAEAGGAPRISVSPG